jgi:hypothetical protein
MNVSVTPRTQRLLDAVVVEQNVRSALMGFGPSDGADLSCYLFSQAVREAAVRFLGEDRVDELEARS